MKTNSKIAIGIAAVIATVAALRKRRSASGIGAVKRRIYKELSLAQQAGVDFTKPYDELTKDEIKALERVSHDTGYTETYYKSLQKAYNAISGIGEAYDVVDESGNTVLTWIEDPETQATKKREIEASKQRALEAEASTQEARKRLKKMRRAGEQMSLFGIGNIPTYNRQQLDAYLNSNHVVGMEADLTNKDKKGYILCGGWDQSGGRSFYLSKQNYLYLRSYCLQNLLSVALWNGEYWITRNMKDDDISGCGYTDDIERELYEIWREQIEYGETEYDYPTWRNVMGDEYVQDVIRYMR